MLHVVENLPEGLLERDATRLHEVLPGPTLIHLPGRRPEPLFVSALLHGNEDAGWLAVRALLKKYATKGLPRALSLFIGNVQAARYRQRFLPGQPDYNRIWTATPESKDLPEHRMMLEVIEMMRARKVFAGVDIHNNTGVNPHYACIRNLDHRFFHLATLFSRIVVFFRKPEGVQIEAFSQLCPAVTVECGKSGEIHGVEHALGYIEACLHLSEIPERPVAPHDIDLFHTVAVVKVPTDTSFSFGDADVDLRFVEGLDQLNFRELPVDTTLGWVRPESDVRLDVRDEQGNEVSDRYFVVRNGEIRTASPFMPSMLTVDAQAVRQDCLCYLMERHKEFYDAAMQQAAKDTPA